MSFGLVSGFGVVEKPSHAAGVARTSVRGKAEGPRWAGLRRVSFRGNLLLRAGPPEIGVVVRAIIFVAGQHKTLRGKRGGMAEAGGD